MVAVFARRSMEKVTHSFCVPKETTCRRSADAVRSAEIQKARLSPSEALMLCSGSKEKEAAALASAPTVSVSRSSAGKARLERGCTEQRPSSTSTHSSATAATAESR